VSSELIKQKPAGVVDLQFGLFAAKGADFGVVD
jgi:hypothetical protein